MSKFSLAEGVTDSFNLMINPGPLPLGATYEAMTRSAKHKRKLPPETEGETDYYVILSMILTFIGADKSKSKRLPMIFVEPGLDNEDFIAAELTLEKILMETGQDFAFRLFSLEQLVHRLRKKCFEMCQNASVSDLEQFGSVELAKNFMSRNEFIYLDIGCDFHRSVDANCYCCLSKVKSWGYMISRYCLNDLDKKIPGRHFPEDSSVQSSVLGLGSDVNWDDEASHSFSQIRIQSRTQSQTTIPQNSEISLKSSRTTLASLEAKSDEVSTNSQLHPVEVPSTSISSRIQAGRRKKKSPRGGKQL